MKVALVHDYIKEFGGAERVLLALSEIYPDAPIYTAFYKKGSPSWERFKDKDIRVSWAHYVPFFSTVLHSPLRFLAPFIWGSFNFSGYDVVITSSSWYITKGIKSTRSTKGTKSKKPIEICYCHTPPRYLYGYKTSVAWQKYWPVRIYASLVNHFLRMYDFLQSQKVDYFIANSKEVTERIKKFYKREATVIYPPVDPLGRVQKFSSQQRSLVNDSPFAKNADSENFVPSPRSYFLVVSRIVGSKGLELAVRAANEMGFKLKIVGMAGGYGKELERLKKIGGKNVEFLGFVQDWELAGLYRNAKAFLATAEDEDFGMTVVESMMAGTPVIAYRGGGYLESVVEGKTGIFFDKPTVDSLVYSLRQFDRLKFDRNVIAEYAQGFSKDRFKKQLQEFVKNKLNSVY